MFQHDSAVDGHGNRKKHCSINIRKLQTRCVIEPIKNKPPLDPEMHILDIYIYIYAYTQIRISHVLNPDSLNL